jgi:hypothetical protein
MVGIKSRTLFLGRSNIFMNLVWTFLIAHWWLPLLVCVILSILLFILDDTMILCLYPVVIIFAIGFASTGFLWNQKYEVITKVILRQ